MGQTITWTLNLNSNLNRKHQVISIKDWYTIVDSGKSLALRIWNTQRLMMTTGPLELAWSCWLARIRGAAELLDCYHPIPKTRDMFRGWRPGRFHPDAFREGQPASCNPDCPCERAMDCQVLYLAKKYLHFWVKDRYLYLCKERPCSIGFILLAFGRRNGVSWQKKINSYLLFSNRDICIWNKY